MRVSTNLEFEIGQPYLVFLHRCQGRLLSAHCDGTRPLPALDAAELAAVGLRELASHLPGERPELGAADPGAPVSGLPARTLVRAGISFKVFAAFGLIGIGVVGYLRRWSRRGPASPG